MKAIELFAVATISGAIGGAASAFMLERYAHADEKPTQTLELEVLKVNRIILGTDLEIPSSIPNQGLPDFILNKDGIANVTRAFDVKKNISATFTMQLTPDEGLRLSYYDADAPNLPALQSRVSPAGLALIGGKIDQTMITVNSNAVSIATKDRHVLLKDSGLTCYHGSETACK